MFLDAGKAREFLLGSSVYWSAKDLAIKLKTTPQDINTICKALGKMGSIAHYYIEFKMQVDGKEVDAKKYFYANWSVSVPSAFKLYNSEFESYKGKPMEPPKQKSELEHVVEKIMLSATGKTVVGQTYPFSTKGDLWKGTYKASSAYNSISTKKKSKTPPEHLLAFFHHYPQCAFTLKFLAVYWDASPGHIACAILERTGGKVHIWKHKGHKVASVAYGPTAAGVKIIDAPSVPEAMLIPEMNALVKTLEPIISKPFIKPSGVNITQEATPIEMLKPNLGTILKADPLMKMGFEIDVVKKPKAPIIKIKKSEPSIYSTSATKVWELRPLSLVQECADLYILIELSLDFPEIKDLMEKKLDFLADQFSKYLDMAIGGEIRDGWNHCSKLPYLKNTVGLKILKYLESGFMPHGSHQRPEAQSAWKTVRNELGLQALEEAFIFFNSGGWGGTYGGPRWAIAVQTLLNYHKGEYSKMTFVDTVWGLQHNCALILNKAWDIDGLAEVLQYKQDGLIVDLTPLASPAIAALWKEKKPSE